MFCRYLILVYLILVCVMPCYAQTIVVTGGAGFIGSHISVRLLQRGDQVIVIDALDNYYDPGIKNTNCAWISSFAKPGQLHIYHGAICDKDEIDRIFAKHTPDAVCHTAAHPNVSHCHKKCITTNILGTQVVLACATNHAIKQIVYLSSVRVYGPSSSAPFDEEDAVDRPVSIYGATKRAAEMICHTYHALYGLNCTCLRLFTVYGPRQRPDMEPLTIFNALDTHTPIVLVGDAHHLNNFIHIDDVVDAVCNSLDKPLGYAVINVGSKTSTTNRQFIELMEQVIGMPLPVIYSHKKHISDDNRPAKIDHAQELLGHAPKVSLKEGLTRMYRWYKDMTIT